jgi:[acyl-carrier-protein] S-malonyltransferase
MSSDMAYAFLFPGQGSQAVGMGKDLAENFPVAKSVFAQVDEALSQKLSTMMWDGPMEDLTMTANAQPALMAVSMAVVDVLKHDFDIDMTQAKFLAGHSLGEYSALCAAGVLSLADTARLLRIRGNAMQSAVPVGVGSMAALLGASLEDAAAAVAAGEAHGICQIANDNAVGQIVLSGEKSAVEAAAAHARENGVKKAVILPVSAPFHCGLMQPAADAMEKALADVTFHAPIVPVVNNVSAAPVTDPAQLKADLVTQVTGRVRWRESVTWMAEDAGITHMPELGSGKVLTVMLRRIVKGINGLAVNNPQAIETLAEQLKG